MDEKFNRANGVPKIVGKNCQILYIFNIFSLKYVKLQYWSLKDMTFNDIVERLKDIISEQVGAKKVFDKDVHLH